MGEGSVNKRVFITGASSGLGRALAEHYARAEWTVGAMARRAELLDQLSLSHPLIEAIIGDVTDPGRTEDLMHDFARRHGGLDLVYANAGLGQATIEQGWDPDRARQIAEVNVVGATNTITAAAGVMLEQGFGRIVGISSLAGCVPLPCAAAYGASKAWLSFYLRSLDIDLAPRGVRCSVVMPGYIATPMVDGPESDLVTRHARRAAKVIAQRVADGQAVIRFPRRVAMLTSIASWLPTGWRTALQHRRLNKRARKAGLRGSAR